MNLVHEPHSPCCGLIYAADGSWHCGNGRQYSTAEGAATALVDRLTADLLAARQTLNAVRGLKNEHVESWQATRTFGGHKAAQPLVLYDDAPADVRARFTANSSP